MFRIGPFAIVAVLCIIASCTIAISITKYSDAASPTKLSNKNNTFLQEVTNSFPGDNVYLHAKVTINGFPLISDVAFTDEQKTKGLDIKNNLSENQGMLFVFQQPGRYGFWMMGMKFPIDIIWLDSNGTVTHIEHSLQPCQPNSFKLFCPTYSPEKDSLYVLETVARFSMKHNVHPGSHVSLELVK